ncbi:hypothetical protein KHS38_15255 [Mucilaginibacter sp. Bleaf8]|uniref:hypothetical protein n=1 Tax=Mucilaginibacter sp. Bleaf8 TaxID=2834430 RepID=UPI001BCE9190|nr:hypothetical protein [Mucilaginibacter sp. Bleaf8]MBS7565765.1 hypothetical protein [Mucilaginibacter sp. Bleaf8]
MHPLLSRNETYQEESFEAMQLRYQGFGKDLYQRIRVELPEVFDHLIFYKATRYQTTDSYAIHDGDSKPFAIQLDPDIALIIFWNLTVHVEIGTWSQDEYGEALNFIKSNLLNTKAN